MSTKLDFYYSPKQAATVGLNGVHAFKKEFFTEAVTAGHKITSLWDDFVFVGTRTDADCVFASKWIKRAWPHE